MKLLRRLPAPDLLTIDDFALRPPTGDQPSVLYEVILEPRRRPSTIVASNRTIDASIPLFDAPIPAQCALDRLPHNPDQIAMEAGAR